MYRASRCEAMAPFQMVARTGSKERRPASRRRGRRIELTLRGSQVDQWLCAVCAGAGTTRGSRAASVAGDGSMGKVRTNHR